MFSSSFFLLIILIVGKSKSWEYSWSQTLGVQPGPQVKATRGEVWPKPQVQVYSEEYFSIRPSIFKFKVIGQSCEILEKALQRYKQELKNLERVRRIIKMHNQDGGRGRTFISDKNHKGYIDELSVDLRNFCEDLPHMNMDEHYELRVNTDDIPMAALLVSQSIWGILRGLETWSQLIYMPDSSNSLIINSTSIMDFPRFSHRGLLIDTSRHFLPVKIIFKMLDAMSMSKLNVLHWHIVDDQSFPFVSQVFPNLSLKGAYSPTHIYTPSDVQSIIKYAAFRGIRVIPEFDTPGHTRSWGEGYPELLTKCNENLSNSLGPLNPIFPGTYEFMEKLMKEIKVTFPDLFIHLGGDETDLSCWESNLEIREYMKSHNVNTQQLEGMYIKKIIELATSLNLTSLVWQEIFDDKVDLPKDSIIQVWKPAYDFELYAITKKGYRALLSSCWYLDSLSSGGDWKKFYECEPLNFQRTDQQKKLVMGGEACMWGEVVDSNNVISRVWPRACATAEKLWSPGHFVDTREAARRLEEHTCRMNRRKIPAQPPNGPGFCPGISFT